MSETQASADLKKQSVREKEQQINSRAERSEQIFSLYFYMPNQNVENFLEPNSYHGFFIPLCFSHISLIYYYFMTKTQFSSY